MVCTSVRMDRCLVSRPKISYGIPNPQDELEVPLYNGYQNETYYGVNNARMGISSMPEVGPSSRLLQPHAAVVPLRQAQWPHRESP
jgi:hypothetical protein